MVSMRLLIGALVAAPVLTQTCSTIRDMDYEGGDILITERAKASDCCADCQATPGCKLYNWMDGICYLKSTQGRAVPLRGSVSGVLGATNAPTPSPNSATCSIQRDVDYEGGDIGETYQDKSIKCCDDCKATPGCKLYNWVDGVCYLKSTKGRAVPLPGSVSGFVDKDTPIDTTTPKPTAPPRTPKPTQSPSEKPTPATTPAPKPVPTQAPVPVPTISNGDFFLHHDGYSLIYNCERRTADRWNYTLGEDKSATARPSSFYVDKSIPEKCQQKSVKTYTAFEGYDRGHLVASSLMNDSKNQRLESHLMTNIVPQASSFNRGIWEQTESLEACYRQIARISTWGGVIYTDDSNDYFVESHGIATPDYMWKVVLAEGKDGKKQIISWFFPNTNGLGKLDEYLTSVKEIEAKLNDGLGPIPVPEDLKAFKASSQWPKPDGCSRKM